MSYRLDPKDPQEIKDYAIDWADLLAGEDEVGLATSTWSVPTGLTKVSDVIDGTRAVIWLAGGTAGQQYELTNHIVTDSATPRTHERTILIPCKEL